MFFSGDDPARNNSQKWLLYRTGRGTIKVIFPVNKKFAPLKYFMALKFRGNFNLVIFLIIKPTKQGSPKKKKKELKLLNYEKINVMR